MIFKKKNRKGKKSWLDLFFFKFQYSVINRVGKELDNISWGGGVGGVGRGMDKGEYWCSYGSWIVSCCGGGSGQGQLRDLSGVRSWVRGAFEGDKLAWEKGVKEDNLRDGL